MAKNTRTDYLNAQRQILEDLFKQMQDAGQTIAANMVSAKLEAVCKELHIYKEP